MTKVIRTVGRDRVDGDKDYTIFTDDGRSFDCERHGSQWLCLGLTFPSLRAVKDAIAEGTFEIVGDDDDDAGSTWGCADPCALLILAGANVEDNQVRRTLDAYGWIGEDGSVDVDRAHREVQRVT